MKSIIIILIFSLAFVSLTNAAPTKNNALKKISITKEQTSLISAKKAYERSPRNAFFNFRYGVCLIKANTNLKIAEKCLSFAAKKNIKKAYLHLAAFYIQQYRLNDAQNTLTNLEKVLFKKDKALRNDFNTLSQKLNHLKHIAETTEDIQIIDSVIVDKDNLLSAYKLSPCQGSLDYYKNVFSNHNTGSKHSVVYINEKKNNYIYSKPNNTKETSLFTVYKLMNKFSNESKLSTSNFGLQGNTGYPFMMPDGVTVYFAAKDSDSMGGYDILVSRYDSNTNSYLRPDRLNPPFNSAYNDYMMVIDENKGVGWFASDRFQPEGKICIYTFIPNKSVRMINSNNIDYLVSRALIKSIKDSWKSNTNYTKLIRIARSNLATTTSPRHNFEFVINDSLTYYRFEDFKDKSALSNFKVLLHLTGELRSINSHLGTLRNKYSQGQENLSNEILSSEKSVKDFNNQIEETTILVRNQEIEALEKK